MLGSLEEFKLFLERAWGHSWGSVHLSIQELVIFKYNVKLWVLFSADFDCALIDSFYCIMTAGLVTR